MGPKDRGSRFDQGLRVSLLRQISVRFVLSR
jgi:hypothetical protein